MMLSDVRDYVESLELADHVYMGSLPDKQEKSIGVYNSKHQQEYKTALGGPQLASYGTKYVTLLIHWNNSPRESEKAAGWERGCRTRDLSPAWRQREPGREKAAEREGWQEGETPEAIFS